jgi:hypothetical protein
MHGIPALADIRIAVGRVGGNPAISKLRSGRRDR